MHFLVAIFEQLVPISGGGTPRISNIIDILVERGHEVSVAASFAADAEEVLQILRCNKVFSLNNVSRLDKNQIKNMYFLIPSTITKLFTKAIKLKQYLTITHNSRCARKIS